MTGGGAGGPLPVLKSTNNLSTLNHSPSPDSVAGQREVSMHSTGGSSESSQPQGQDAIMSASGFVHAQGEHVSLLAWMDKDIAVLAHARAYSLHRCTHAQLVHKPTMLVQTATVCEIETSAVHVNMSRMLT